jgi:hypothetical protein
MKTIYLKSLKYDSIFFFSPLIFSIIFTIILKIFFPEYLTIKTDPLWLFVFTIIFDVAHVWWSLYRVYFNSLEFNAHKKLYTITPIIVFLAVFWLVVYEHTWTLLFWIIWFFAVYHFIKQQVWFILLYWHKEKNRHFVDSIVDKILWFSITWFPMLYWFSNLDTRNYIWFFVWEFVKLPTELFPMLWIVFFMIILSYTIYEIIRNYFWKWLNLAKYTYIFVTFFIWFNWIVWNNSLLIFAFWNMLLHWLNYLWIVYLSTKNKLKNGNYKTNKYIKKILSYWFFWFISILLIIATTEEYLWDQFFRHERWDFWGNSFYDFSNNLNTYILSAIIAILSIPQLTHYFLDWYIWRKEFKADL